MASFCKGFACEARLGEDDLVLCSLSSTSKAPTNEMSFH